MAWDISLVSHPRRLPEAKGFQQQEAAEWTARGGHREVETESLTLGNYNRGALKRPQNIHTCVSMREPAFGHLPVMTRETAPINSE